MKTLQRLKNWHLDTYLSPNRSGCWRFRRWQTLSIQSLKMFSLKDLKTISCLSFQKCKLSNETNTKIKRISPSGWLSGKCALKNCRVKQLHCDHKHRLAGNLNQKLKDFVLIQDLVTSSKSSSKIMILNNTDIVLLARLLEVELWKRHPRPPILIGWYWRTPALAHLGHTPGPRHIWSRVHPWDPSRHSHRSDQPVSCSHITFSFSHSSLLTRLSTRAPDPSWVFVVVVFLSLFNHWKVGLANLF